MQVVIIDYGSGNLRSVAKSFAHVAAETGFAGDITVTGDAAALDRASHVVLPGVGAFADCMDGLGRLAGMVGALGRAVRERGLPFLGICVGMQLMAARGTEHGDHAGLGWVSGEVTALAPRPGGLKIPHMGWNELSLVAPDHPVLAGLGGGAHAYFVHSYAFSGAPSAEVLAEVEYGGPVCAAIGRENMVGVQFHPEKSQATGLRLIANFLKWRP